MPVYAFVAAAALVALVASIGMRAAVFHHSVAAGTDWRTACPNCAAALVTPGWRVATSVLRPTGRCPRCAAPIGPAAGIVEVLALVTVAAIAWRNGVHVSTVALVFAALLGVVLGLIDVAVHRLPDRLVGTALAGTVIVFGVATATGVPYSRLLIAAACGIATGAFYTVLVFVGGMGLGDAKLAVLIGLVTGWFGVRATVLAVFAGILYGGLGAVVMVALRRAGRGDHLPYGPFMLLGALTAILLVA
jgi:leader peptidase (prepilin peptidase)/N-methyltransferase